jgi:alpha-glucuronidase
METKKILTILVVAWNPARSLDEIYNEWIVQTFGPETVKPAIHGK